MRSGVRQGCPLSPLLYVLCIEPLLRWLASNPSIARVALPGIGSKPTLFAYADDLTICTSDTKSVEEALDVMDVYMRASGGRLNKAKSSIVAINGAVGRTAVGDIPVVQSTKVLGVHFARGGASGESWKEVGDTLQSLREEYKGVLVSFGEKRQFIVSHMLSKIWYLGTCFPPSKKTAKVLTRIVMSFFWEGKCERVKRSVVQAPAVFGGFDIPDIGLKCDALAMAQICRILDDDDHIAKPLMLYCMGTGSRVFSGSLNHTVPMAETPTVFYSGIIRHASIVQQAVPSGSLAYMRTNDLFHELYKRFGMNDIRIAPLENRGLVVSNLLQGDRADIAWELSHNILPVNTRLFRFHFVSSMNCDVCGGIENHRHVFFECVLAEALWRKAATVFRVPRIIYETVLYSDPLPVTTGRVPSFVLLMGEIKYEIWTSRKRRIYGGTSESLRKSSFYIGLNIRKKLQAELETLDELDFKRRWKKHRLLFSIAEKKVKVSF
ncbi:uncharacterized protein LOC135388914 [Ornithodoros turicata]|uniref:uncharacterized protein LOC135388914 n=1 Tax=Ornithodoros turicata TaxID=34597 RepID=UPI0031391317